jgi:hypothetical protein
MSVGQHLQEIYDDNGAITPQLVVETARDDEHPLHGHFVWDDTVAGELYRCNQAAQMIRRVTIRRTTPDGDDVVTRAWVSRTEIEGQAGDEPPIGQYLPVEVVISSPDLRPKYEQAMEREWKALYAKYKEYQTFIAMVTADIQAVA